MTRATASGDSEPVRRLRLWDVLAHVLSKQHLGGDGTGSDLVGVVGDLVGLHATLPTTPYLSLAARLPEFRREQLERELYEQRRLVRIKCLRGTVFIVPTATAGVLLGRPAARTSNAHAGTSPGAGSSSPLATASRRGSSMCCAGAN